MARLERTLEQMKEIVVEEVDSESNSEILDDDARLVGELNQVSDNPVLEVGIWKLGGGKRKVGRNEDPFLEY
jgi:hypothetical protein